MRVFSFGCQGVLLSIYIRLPKNALPWRDASLPSVIILTVPPLLLDLPVSRTVERWWWLWWWGGGHLRTILLRSKCVHRSVSLNQRKPERCSRAACSHFTHCEPGTTVAGDVRIWLLGQLFESEETRFLIAFFPSSSPSYRSYILSLENCLK